MEQCWDADPSKRPNTYTLWYRIQEMNLRYQKPRNATKEELEAFYSGNNPNLHSKEQNYLEIPDDTNEL
ncbi:unnamed protein product [Rhizophagus irregularis]|nr:unnamed protein product [Rhizophagus irregularis]